MTPPAGWTKIFVRDLALQMQIGVNENEHGRLQPVLVNVLATIEEPDSFASDRLEKTVSYDTIVRDICALVAQGHIGLVENLAEQIAGIAMADVRVLDVLVDIEKHGVYDGQTKVGAQLFRRREPNAR